MDLVQEVGWSTFSFRHLAEKVGIRAASIHYHFPTKADLGLAMIERMRRDRSARANALASAHPDVRARIQALGELIAGHLCAGNRSCPVYAFQAEFAVLPAPVQVAVTAWIEDVIVDLSHWLEVGRSAGHVRFPGEARLQALILWSVLQQGTQLQRTHPNTDFLAIVRHFVASISAS